MAETIGTLIVTAIAEATAAEAFVAAAEATYLGVSGLTIIGTVAILGATIGLQYLLGQPSGADLPKASSGAQPLRQPLPPHVYAYGRCRLAGCYVLFEARGGFSYDVQALHKGRICQYIKFYLHDDEAIVQPDGSVTGAVGSGDLRYASGAEPALGGSPSIVIEYRLGLPRETAYDRPRLAMPDLWTTDHRGDGIASVAMTCGTVKVEHVSAMYPQGLPKLSAVGDWLPVWDPRQAGQDRRNLDTLGPVYNPVLQAIDFLLDTEHGLGFDYDEVIAPVLDQLMIEASICDELVAKADGSSERRYQSSGFWTSQTDPASVLDAIMSTCDGWYSFNGSGTLSLKVGKYRPPTVTLTQDHIIGFAVTSGIEDENACNCLNWSFTDPANKYRDAPGDAWLDEADILERGELRSQTVSLTWVQSHSQGRRLVKRKMAQTNPRRRGTLTTTFYGIVALGERWVRVQDDRHVDLADAIIQLGKAVIDLSAQRITFEWIAVNTNDVDAWDAAQEEGMQPSTGEDSIGDTLPVPANPAGVKSGTSALLSFDDPARPDLTYVVQYRIGLGAWTQVSVGAGTAAAGRVTVTVTGLSVGQTYQFQIASQRTIGALSAWSGSVTVAI
ncbi:hypothetical protein ACQR1Y_12260 [Bradyrhizobium sp. HKCCYLRH3099]|uniref:hypothetical protein n=1 Tax=unclassified Bradyrhizobium TaxID=2631580 RepID=UPI003EBAC9AE